MENSAHIFNEIVENRRSVRIFDEEALYDESIVERSLQRTIQAPSSSNMQLWEFYRVLSSGKKKQLSEACFDQSTARTANELVVIVVRRDLWRKRQKFNLQEVGKFVEGRTEKHAKRAIDYYSKLIPFIYIHDFLGIAGRIKQLLSFGLGLFRTMHRQSTLADARIGAHKSAALAAMTFMYSIKSEGLDTCPMEGFDSWKVKKILGLGRKTEINMVISVGKRKPEGVYNPRWRVPYNEVVKTI